jgi:lysophospholipase L1-like esterase
MDVSVPTAMPDTRPPQRTAGARKVWLTLLMSLGLLTAAEVALQLRSQWRTGQSIFTSRLEEPRYVRDPESGLLLLSPNRVVKGSQVTLRSNAMGLRSPEIPVTRSPGSWRIAVIGASTVMGAYAADTDQTFPLLLQQRLRERHPGRLIEVVNAGIVGFTLRDQQRMLETKVAALQPDLVIVYPGFNDFAGYCRAAKTEQAPRFTREPLHRVEAPPWLLSIELVRKNTVFLRTQATRRTDTRDASALDTEPYRQKLQQLTSTAAALKMPLVLATNARAFRPEQPMAEQLRLSETARYYNHCFDLQGLHKLYDVHNDLIREHAAATGLPLVDLAEAIPGGPKYFADASHFSPEGEHFVAEHLAVFLERHRLLPD